MSEFKHYRINHSQLFADKQNHINGIENFRNQAKRHLRRFNGIDKKHFYFFLKECEWRFNILEHLKILEKLESSMFENISTENKLSTYGLFATDDELFSYKDEFSKHFSNIISISGGHIISADEIRNSVVPLVKQIIDN